MAKVELPVGVPAVVAMVRVELPEETMVAGEKAAEALPGKPAAERFTVPTKPFTAATFTV